MPGTNPAVRGLNQTGPTRFSPFGPFTQQMIIHYYSDFDVMFQHFLNGDIDISDWNLESPTQVNTFCSNPDFYCTSPQDELGYFGLEINNHPPFMGIALTQPRTTAPPTFTIMSSATGCGTGFGSLSITLRNQETGTTVLDLLNTITVRNQPSGSPSATVSDSGGSTPNGVYNLPCILAGTYSIASSVYNATGTQATIASATAASGTLNVNWNSPSNVRPTQARALLGGAMTHLFDDPVFVNSLFGAVAKAPCGFLAGPQGLACPSQSQIDNAECQFANHPWLNVVGCQLGATGHDVSAYNIATDDIGAGSEWWTYFGSGNFFFHVGLGYSGQADLRAACDNFVSMGLSIFNTTGHPGHTSDCNDVANAASGTVDPGSYPHLIPAGDGHIVFAVRLAQGRWQFGAIVADALDFLFGTPSDRVNQASFVGTVCWTACPQYTPRIIFPQQEQVCVFEDTPASGGNPNCWQLYTAGQGFDPTPDQFFFDRNSINSGAVCAGAPAIKPNNYNFWCDPESDTMSSAGEVAPTLTSSGQFLQRNVAIELNGAVDIPGFDFAGQFAENNGWSFQQCPTQGVNCASSQSSIVNTLGFGTLASGAYFTMLNARQIPGYNPCAVPGAPSNCAAYSPGGGNPNFIRRGFSQDTFYLSPFTFNSVWEADFLSFVFDTMLQTAPSTGGADAQLIDWGTTSHSSRFSPNEIGCNSIYGCVTGVTTQIWHLRNDLKFSDGHDVKATDVAYSIIADRDVPSSSLQPFVVNVVSATGLDCGPGQPCKTLEVKLQGQSALNEFNIGQNIPILEKSLWAPYCGDPPIAGGTCASPVFDPMFPSGNSPGIEVGTGPWNCVVPAVGAGHIQFVAAGHVGGPCAETASGDLTGGAITTDGQIFLSENTFNGRCCPNGPSATTSSLYKISYADFNNDGVVNILDLAAVASAFGTADPYWVNSNIAPGSTVNAEDLATVAIYFGHGITYPYTPQTLANVDPQIDPFFCPNTGC